MLAGFSAKLQSQLQDFIWDSSPSNGLSHILPMRPTKAQALPKPGPQSNAVPTKRRNAGEGVVADRFLNKTWLYIKMLYELQKKKAPNHYEVCTALRTLYLLKHKDQKVVKPHNSARWVIKCLSTKKAKEVTSRPVKIYILGHEAKMDRFYMKGPQTYIADKAPYMPGVNETIARQIHALKETGGKKFYLAKAYTNGTHGPHILYIFEESPDLLRFFVPIGHQNPGHKTPFQVRFMVAGQDLKCLQYKSEYTLVYCPNVFTIGAPTKLEHVVLEKRPAFFLQ